MHVSYFADCVVVTSCYKLDSSWKNIRTNDLHNENSLCEDQCKEAIADYRYHGTNVSLFCF